MGEESSGYKVEFSMRSRGIWQEIVDYIADDNPQAAERFGHELIHKAESLASHPELGRVVPEIGDSTIRERIFGLYRIVYRVDHAKQLIVVSRFWHAARGEPEVTFE